MIENLEEQIDVIKKSLRSFYLSFQFNGVIKKMGNCFKITIGKTPPTKERKWFTNDSRAGIKWLSIKDMKDNGDYIFSTSKHLTSQAQSEFNIPLVQKGDILLSFKLTLGRVGISTLNMITNEAIACFKYDQTYMPYLYCFLSNYNFEKKIESTSSIGKAFNSSILKNLDFLYPFKSNVMAFNEISFPLLNSILNLREKQEKLKKVKTYLLQKYF